MIAAPFHPEARSWREVARALLNAEVPPADVHWHDQSQSLLPLGTPLNVGGSAAASCHHVPRAFPPLCALVAAHRDPDRWALMYRVLWRLTHGEPHLLQIAVDPDMHRLLMMQKAVRRDCHKMTAFVRFRRVEDGTGARMVAWHQPDHHIIHLTAPFFAERFAAMRWAILTPEESVTWDGERLCFGPGVPRSQAPRPDELEPLWKTYYGSIFNPARVNLRAMVAEMPARHWATLPETQIIGDLLADAPCRVAEMVARAASVQCPELSPSALAPTATSLPQLRDLAVACQGCSLHCRATQTVFGEGPGDAQLVFVGEQPGDEEDLGGRPFIGPAGRLFDEVLREAGIPRDAAYVTNAVKHFKWEPRGKKRMHRTPSAREVVACTPWVAAELTLIRPRILVCLGATAARALLGRDFQLMRERGRPRPSRWAAWTLATWHPAALLRIPDPAGNAQARKQFSADLRLVAEKLSESSGT